jgi:hypothetical protein
VEAWLADDPEARRIFEEMRVLGSDLRSLPQQKLNVNLTEKVLEIARQRNEAGNDGVSKDSRLASMFRKISVRVQNNPRMIVWPLIVVSVAILLTVLHPETQPNGKGDRSIAMDRDDGRETQAVTTKENVPKAASHDAKSDGPSISAVGPARNQIPPNLVMKGEPSGNAPKPMPKPLPGGSLAGLIVVQCKISRDVLAGGEYRNLFETAKLDLPDQTPSELLQATSTEIAEAAGIDASILDDAKKPEAERKALSFVVEISPEQMRDFTNALNAQPAKFAEFQMKRTASLPGETKSTAKKRMLVIFHVE